MITNLWYKDAFFYELSLRSFMDSNGDVYGDLRGLMEKLDYLQTLGVDCLWLMPINNLNQWRSKVVTLWLVIVLLLDETL